MLSCTVSNSHSKWVVLSTSEQVSQYLWLSVAIDTAAGAAAAGGSGDIDSVVEDTVCGSSDTQVWWRVCCTFSDKD